MALQPFAGTKFVMELVNRELLTAKEVSEQRIAGSREDMLGKHHYMLVLSYLFEVDTDGCCQGPLVSLTMVILIIHPVTVPPSLLTTERVESNGTPF